MSADYDDIRKRVERRVNRRYQFYRHLGSYLTTNLILWAIYFVTNGFHIGPAPWPMWVTIFWGIGMISEASKVFADSGMLDDMRERELQRELEREKDRLYREGYEKPKRGDVVSLGDDGELIYDDEDEETAIEKRKRTIAEQ
ncbi:MAG: 2TM domain-containing protein [Anaerolineae bacterium]|nr:2TM domain-containing protein [Anaerolineae bacterium]